MAINNSIRCSSKKVKKSLDFDCLGTKEASHQGIGGFEEDNQYLVAYKGKGLPLEAGVASCYALEAYRVGLPLGGLGGKAPHYLELIAQGYKKRGLG